MRRWLTVGGVLVVILSPMLFCGVGLWVLVTKPAREDYPGGFGIIAILIGIGLAILIDLPATLRHLGWLLRKGH
ncbi:MAG TPA: hypothetical protein VI542_21385 [Candidatus Tectomicrobia bacterium]